jgi:hypothetical protein
VPIHYTGFVTAAREDAGTRARGSVCSCPRAAASWAAPFLARRVDRTSASCGPATEIPIDDVAGPSCPTPSGARSSAARPACRSSLCCAPCRISAPRCAASRCR